MTSVNSSRLTRRIATPLPWLAGLLAIYLVAPLVAGAQQAGLADWSSVDADALLRACVVSIASATVATLIIALTGVPLGYVLARLPGRMMATIGFLVQLPLALPPLASGVLLLFLGLIHVAPLGATPHSSVARELARGNVHVDATPWARISVDGKLVGTTPLGRPLELPEGPHTIRFQHDWYMPVEKHVDVAPGDTSLSVDFEKQHVPLLPGKVKPE